MQKRLDELLLTELARQGVQDPSAWHTAILRATSWSERPNPNSTTDGTEGGATTESSSMPATIITMNMNCNNLGLNDRIVSAITEALLKFAQQGGARPGTEWLISFANNKLTDRVAPHLVLLLTACASVGKLDLSNNGLSPDGLSRINVAYNALAAKPLLFLEGNKASAAQGKGASQSSMPNSAAKSGTSATTSSSHGGVYDIPGWKRKRDQLFREEALSDTKEAEIERDKLVKELGLEQSFGEVAVSEGHTSTAGTPNVSGQYQVQRGGRGAAAGRGVGRAGAQTAAAARGGRAGGRGAATAVQRPSQDERQKTSIGSSRRNERARKMYDFDSTSGDDDGPPELTNTQTDHRRKRRSHRNPKEEKHTTARPLSPAASPQLGSTSSEDDLSDGNSSQLSHSSDNTQATEVPDKQDMLDLTADITNFDICKNLNGSGLAHSMLFDQNELRNLTVLSIANNNVEGTLPSGVLPPTLTRFDCSNNLIEDLGGALFGCKLLSVVNARRNLITSVGDSLRYNVSLAHLFLGRNRLRRLLGLSHLVALEVLDISFNEFRTESSLRSLSMHSNLRHLICCGNPVFDGPTAGNDNSTAGKNMNLSSTSALRKNPRAMLRNLVPTLVALDNERLNFSRQAEQSAITFLNQTASMYGGMGVSGINNTTMGASTMMSSAAQNNTGMGRSATGPSGYSAPGRVEQKMKLINQRHQIKRDKDEVAKRRVNVSKGEVLAGIAAQNKARLEQAVVDRMSALHMDPNAVGSTVDENDEKENNSYAAVHHQRQISDGLASAGVISGNSIYTKSAQNDVSFENDPYGDFDDDMDDDETSTGYQPSQGRGPGGTGSRAGSQGPQRSQTLDADRWEEQRRAHALSSSPINKVGGTVGGGNGIGATSPGSSSAAEAFLRNIGAVQGAGRHERTFSGGQESTDFFPDHLSDGGMGTTTTLHGHRHQPSNSRGASPPAVAQRRSRGGSTAHLSPRAAAALQQSRMTTQTTEIAQSLHDDYEEMGDPMEAEELVLSPQRSTTNFGGRRASDQSSGMGGVPRNVFPLLGGGGGQQRGGKPSGKPERSPPLHTRKNDPRSPAGAEANKKPPQFNSPPSTTKDAPTEKTSFSNNSAMSPILRDADKTDLSGFHAAPQEQRTGGHRSASPVDTVSRAVPKGLLSPPPAAASPEAHHTPAHQRHASPSAVPFTASRNDHKQVGPTGARRPPSVSRDGSAMSFSDPNNTLTAPSDQQVVQEWLQQLQQDSTAVRIAFRTLLIVLQSEDRGTEDERSRCLGIIKRSGMLEDTEIPSAVVENFEFTEGELNEEPGTVKQSPEQMRGIKNTTFFARRQAILKRVHTLGESKTCMRYIVALIENKREDLLGQYLDRIRDVIPQLIG